MATNGMPADDGAQPPGGWSIELREEDVELLAALMSFQFSRKRLCEVAHLVGLRTADGKRLSVQDLRPFLEPLISRRVLHATGIDASHMSFDHERTWTVLRGANARDRLGLLASAMSTQDTGYTYAPRNALLEHLSAAAPVQVALALGRLDSAKELLHRALRYEQRNSYVGPFVRHVLGREPEARWLGLVAAPVLASYMAELVDESLRTLVPISPAVLDAALRCDSPSLRARAARLAVLRDHPFDIGEVKLTKQARADHDLVEAMLRGDHAGALRFADTVNGKDPAKQRALEPDVRAALIFCWVIASGTDGGAWARLTTRLLAEKQERNHGAMHDGVDAFVHTIQFGQPPARSYRDDADTLGPAWVADLCAAVLGFWRAELGPENLRPRAKPKVLEQWLARAQRHGFPRAALLLQQTLRAVTTGQAAEGSLAGAYRTRAGWELALEALAEFAGEDTAIRAGRVSHGAAERLQWQLRLEPKEGWTIGALYFKSGTTRVGREVAIEKLLTGSHPYLRDIDRAVLAHAEADPYSGYGRRSRMTPMVLKPTALLALVGHDSVVDAEGRPLQVLRGEGELRAEARPSGATRVSLQPPELAQNDLVAISQPPEQVVVYERTPELSRLAHLLTSGALEVPPSGAKRLGEVLGQVGRRVRVGAGEDVQLSGELVPAETRLAFLCRWSGERLEVRLRAVPLGLAGPQALPGRGPAQMVAVLDGRPLRTERHLDAERRAREALLIAAPGVGALPWEDDNVTLEGLPGAYDFLTEVGALPEKARLLAWPDGKRLPVPRSVGVEALRVRVSGAGGKLLSSIDVEVDTELVVGFQQLLASQATGRFVHVDDHTVLALTEELRRRVEGFSGLGKLGRQGLVSEPVLLPRLMELSEDVGTRTLDAASKKRVAALEQALATNVSVPRGFAAELRDYQREGFVWLARLGEAELGACLADDMGLGKTVQTLALLAHRAKAGPALVLTPTSVVGTWLSETQRFAPRLNVTLLAESGDRAAVIAAAGPHDVLVASYGVLVTESEALSARRFETVVFDEAHALKNAGTQRSQAAAQLNAGFRVALTGTPIENHLGELWSLMRAVVPGLLGSEREFNLRFVEPIAGGKRDRLAELRLRLRPFLLRRTKAEVLDELPERSETTLLVTPTPAERAYYEALRRKVEERLATQRDAPTGSARVEILAEIMRLRQVAVDPRLLDPKHGPPGAKLDVLAERVRALHEEGHQPLIFTQFLGSLARIEERLVQEGLKVLTLDGSLSAKERTKRVAAFQAGEADAFVMSLHAGGTGVTLTAADYVFHVDPWWNPAVEDQATGRAHRIGQKRPVHVYRLVTAGTIEEKILALHGSKKRMAGDLLEGLDDAKKLDLETLRGLLSA
ncbi:MAG: DEAD/DEAH box helicase [Sandaracinaceae bacterium]|nr:DEAD/DEAH box helicase [Sandaracinaceae bacterium]